MWNCAAHAGLEESEVVFLDEHLGMAMDPELWGDLQHHISLPECVYLKLPLREFFQLRGVCKDWNRLALDRRCLTDPLRTPYITMVRKSNSIASASQDDKHSLHGMLAFDIGTSSFPRWRWTPHPEETGKPFHVLCRAFVAKRMTFDHHDLDENPTIYDGHANREHLIPRPPNSVTCGALGISVDNSVMPHTFKLILGGVGMKTQVYDSVRSSWTTRASILAPEGRPHAFALSLHCADCVYIWSQVDQILVYSLKDDVWSVLSPSPSPATDSLPNAGSELGSWRRRVFTVMDGGCITTFVVGDG